jgi:hypothetical protein
MYVEARRGAPHGEEEAWQTMGLGGEGLGCRQTRVVEWLVQDWLFGKRPGAAIATRQQTNYCKLRTPIQGATGCYKGIGGVLAKMETGVEASSWRWMPRENSPWTARACS